AAPVAAAEAGAPEGTFHLTPDALLYYCSRRLDSIDLQIKTYFEQQQKKNVASKQLGDLQAILGRTDHQKGGDQEGFDPNIHASESNEILKIYREASDPEVKKAAAEAFKIRSGHDVSDYSDPTTSVSAKDVENAKGNI